MKGYENYGNYENEEIYFEGTYNINNVNQTGPTILSLQAEIENNPNGYNLLIDNFYNTKDNLIPPNNFLLETITISSYQNDITEKVGQIQYTSFYKNDSPQDSATTEEKFILYIVNSADGIYEGVTKVLLQAITDQRKIFFIGPKRSY